MQHGDAWHAPHAIQHGEARAAERLLSRIKPAEHPQPQP